MKNPFSTFFERLKEVRHSFQRWREFGGYTATFHNFGRDINKSDLVRACIRPLADQTAKAFPHVARDPELERLLTYNPNQFMNGKDFLYKVRTMYEVQNTVFVVIMKDRNGKVTGFYPMNYTDYEALEDEQGYIYLRFKTKHGTYFFSWNDVIVLRKDYNNYDVSGDDNDALLATLDLLHVSNQSIANAIKSTANLRGIIKTKQSMVDPDDLKKIKDRFVDDYMNAEHGDGIGALDSTTDFIQTNMSPTVASWTQMREFRDNIYRYFGVNEAIVTSKATPEEMQTFYEMKIEPFLIALSQEMTRKVYTERQIAFGNTIVFNSSTIQFMSMSDKLALSAFIDRGALTPNEWRQIVGFEPIDGGDVPIRRLDTAPVEEIETEPVNEEGEQDNE